MRRAGTRPIPVDEKDAAFLALVFVVTSLPYLFGLGFYSDDYAFMGMMAVAEDQSYAGVLGELMESRNLAPRPVQPVYLAFLYKAFGITPLPAHLLNHIFLLLGGVFFYAGLRVMRLPRLYCIALPLIYLTMPHYASNRFWLAAYNIVLSMTFYFAAFYCSARCSRGSLNQTWPWLIGIALFSALSFLSYEIFFFLLIVTPALTALPIAYEKGAGAGLRRNWLWRSPVLAQLALIATILAAGIWLKTYLLSGHRMWEGTFTEWWQALLWLYRGTIKTGLWHHGVKFPVNVFSLAKDHARPEAILAAIAVFAITLAWLMPLARRRKASVNWSVVAALGFLGLIIYFGSFIVFANNFQIAFSPTGIANRVLIAPAAGLAVTALAIAMAVDRLLLRRLGGMVLPILVALGCASGTLVNATLGLMWTDAAQAQNAVVRDIRTSFPSLETGTQILVDRLCPFVGPGPVFESPWDLKGVLRIHYGDPSLRADIIKPDIEADETAVTTTMYGVVKYRFPYRRLVIYNMADKQIWPIPNYGAAQAYFATHAPKQANGCVFEDGGGIDVYRRKPTQSEAR